MLGSTSLDKEDIAILDDVILTLGHDLTSGLDGSFITEFAQNTVVVRNSLNEGLLEVGVNNTGRSGGLDALTDGPLANLILTSGEEAGQVENLAHGGDDLGQTRLGAQVLALLSSGGIVVHQSQTLLELSRDGQDGVTGGVGLDPFEDLGEVLVLLTNVISLTQVNQVHHRLGSEEEQRVDDFDLETRWVSEVSQKVLSDAIEDVTPISVYNFCSQGALFVSFYKFEGTRRAGFDSSKALIHHCRSGGCGEKVKDGERKSFQHTSLGVQSVLLRMS